MPNKVGNKSPLTKITESPGEHKIPKYELQSSQNSGKSKKGSSSKRSSPETKQRPLDMKSLVKKTG